MGTSKPTTKPGNSTCICTCPGDSTKPTTEPTTINPTTKPGNSTGNSTKPTTNSTTIKPTNKPGNSTGNSTMPTSKPTTITPTTEPGNSTANSTKPTTNSTTIKPTNKRARFSYYVNDQPKIDCATGSGVSDKDECKQACENLRITVPNGNWQNDGKSCLAISKTTCEQSNSIGNKAYRICKQED